MKLFCLALGACAIIATNWDTRQTSAQRKLIRPEDPTRKVKGAEVDGFKESATTVGKLGIARLIVSKRKATRPRDRWVTERPKSEEQEVRKQCRGWKKHDGVFAVRTYLSGRHGSSG